MDHGISPHGRAISSGPGTSKPSWRVAIIRGFDDGGRTYRDWRGLQKIEKYFDWNSDLNPKPLRALHMPPATRFLIGTLYSSSSSSSSFFFFFFFFFFADYEVTREAPNICVAPLRLVATGLPWVWDSNISSLSLS
jgi:hypothetical protein